MSVNLTPVNIGTEPNNGSGDPIRTAFDAVNHNFTEIKSKIEGLSNGVIDASYISTSALDANTSSINYITVNNSATFNGNVVANILSVNTAITTSTITSTGNITVGGNLHVGNDVTITGNLAVLGSASVINSTDLNVHDSLITLHTLSDNATLSADDGKDIGLVFNYYKDSAKSAALVWANDTGSLEYYSTGTQNSLTGTFSGTYGNIKAGSFFAADTSASSITTNGGITAAGTISATNLSVSGNAAIGTATIGAVLEMPTPLNSSNNISGSLWLTGTDNVYINGVPVTTSTSHFTGGMVPNLAWFVNGVTANSQVASTSTTSGAMTIDGGLGVTGNIYAGAIYNTPISGSSGDFTSLSVASTFAASSVSFLGGYITNVHGDATQWTVTDFTSGNVKITGGTATGLTSLGSSNVALTSGTITGLTSFGAANATITSGSLTGLSQVTSTNITSTTGLTSSGAGARIAGDFSNATVTNRLLLQTTTTNGATNISTIPRGTIAATALAGSFRIEDTSSVATGNGASGGFELYQNTDVRIVSSIRGTGTYLPLTVYTNGTKNAQFSTNHDFTVFNTGGTVGVITLGANGAAYATSFNGALNGDVTGTVLTAAQPNITSVGTLDSLTVTGNISGSALYDNGSRVVTSATISNFGVSQIIAGTNVTISPVGGTGVVTINASVNSFNDLTTSGDVTVGGNLTVNGTTTTINTATLDVEDLNITVAKFAATAAAANGAGLTVAGANATFTYVSATDTWALNKNVTGTSFNSITGLASTVPSALGTANVGTSTTAARADHVHQTPTIAASALSGTTLASGVTASSLTSVGTLGSLTVSGTTTVPSITKSGTTGAGDIGQSTNTFATVYATTFSGVSTTAKYADLAEIYLADKNYIAGTVVVFGGRDEITVNDKAYDTRIAGVVSTQPAYLMNDSMVGLQENGSYAIPVALTGRVPCRVIGPIKKGDLMVASKFAGIAQAIDNTMWVPGCVIGKALSDVPNVEITIIEVVIGRF